MPLHKSHINKSSLEDIFSTYFTKNQGWDLVNDQVNLLVLIVNTIRPKKNAAKVGLEKLIKILEENPDYKESFKNYLDTLFKDRFFTEMITDVGLPSEESFGREFRKRLTDKILPETSDSRKMRYLFKQVFHQKNDFQWVTTIDYNQLVRLFDVLEVPEIDTSFEQEGSMWQIYYSVVVIALRASGSALEKDIVNLTPSYQNKNSPFVALYREIEDLWDKASSNNELKSKDDEDYKQIYVLLQQCKNYLAKAYKGSETYGITLQTNRDINRIREQLKRIELMLPLLVKEEEDIKNIKLTHLFYILMEIHSSRKKLMEFVSDSTRLVASEISSHKAKTGEKYISSSVKEYWKMLYTALGGGFIVGILCIIKLLLTDLQVSDFGHAFFYSLNYSIGFMVLYLMGFTLATKQPAMTASTLVDLIEKGINLDVKARYRYKAFAVYFSHLFRTQFIAFVGNVVMAMIVASLGVYIIYLLTGNDITIKAWPKLLYDLNPTTSKALFHAGIAGVFLFVSGIIAGQVANRNKFYGISKRLADNPTLKWTFGLRRAEKLKTWYDNKWAGVISNLWFGVFMGSTASIGVFLGLDLDIRHITFAAGNFGLALFGSQAELSVETWFWSILGIGLIGFMNFIVSFGLSLLLAFKSKNVPLRELKPLSLSVIQEIKTDPWSFFFPVHIEKKKDTLSEKIKESIDKKPNNS
ncbi:site-specific recombinase [Weeksellaceae bacterium KMM 9713]|uniref:Site-specific recombinase n=1 Tax=Profundicola chukchiensis TaxID=2961959 RepID=A0A9X4RTL5_9FLAO|nr:recombinase [Profundicola chukchiensis]MDG4945148.1 site-specific recombinase [Profundicola chukchiensis]